MVDLKVTNPGKPDENTPDTDAECLVPGPVWKTGTLEPSISKFTVVTCGDGDHDEVSTVNTRQYGSDYEPSRGFPHW